MSALLITGSEVRLELVLTPQAHDINLVLGLESHALTILFVADYITQWQQKHIISAFHLRPFLLFGKKHKSMVNPQHYKAFSSATINLDVLGIFWPPLTVGIFSLFNPLMR